MASCVTCAPILSVVRALCFVLLLAGWGIKRSSQGRPSIYIPLWDLDVDVDVVFIIQLFVTLMLIHVLYLKKTETTHVCFLVELVKR